MAKKKQTLKGKVCGGIGNASRCMKKHKDHYRELLGVDLVAGTLNIELPQPYEFPEKTFWHGSHHQELDLARADFLEIRVSLSTRS